MGTSFLKSSFKDPKLVIFEPKFAIFEPKFAILGLKMELNSKFGLRWVSKYTIYIIIYPRFLADTGILIFPVANMGKYPRYHTCYRSRVIIIIQV